MMDMKTDVNKTSAFELEEVISMYKKGMNKKCKITASESNTGGICVTAQMSGKILLSILNRTKEGHNVHIDAEIAERGIEPPMSLDEMTWADKKNLLKIDEFKILAEKGQLMNTPEWKDVKEIWPQSDKMRELFKFQKTKLMEKQTKHKKAS